MTPTLSVPAVPPSPSPSPSPSPKSPSPSPSPSPPPTCPTNTNGYDSRTCTQGVSYSNPSTFLVSIVISGPGFGPGLYFPTALTSTRCARFADPCSTFQLWLCCALTRLVNSERNRASGPKGTDRRLCRCAHILHLHDTTVFLFIQCSLYPAVACCYTSPRARQ